MKLRDYQQDAVNAVFEGVKNGQMSGVIVAPTGSGKSIILAEISRILLTTWVGTKVVVATHVYELLEQNAEKFHLLCPDIQYGIYSAGLKRKETKERIVFAGIQSAAKHAFDFGKVDMLIIDECHRINPNEQTQYGRFIKNLKINNPNVVIVGLSATPYRMDRGLLWEGDNALFEGPYYDISIIKLIEDKYLSPVISKGGVEKIDLKGVKTTAGDYNQKQLEKAASGAELTRAAVDEILACTVDRKSVIIFCTGVDHANMVCREINRRNRELHLMNDDEIAERHLITNDEIKVCRVITGNTPTEERKHLLDDYKNGKFKYLANVNVLTTGFDNPNIDVIVLLTATKSCAKYIQMVGRGMRLAEGKENCLLLDYGGNVIRHGCINDVCPLKQENGGGDAPVKECPDCHTFCSSATKKCPNCGQVLSGGAKRDAISHDEKAYEGDVISSDIQWLDVDEVDYIRHKKAGKPDSIRIDFYVTSRQKPYPMWITPDHGGYAHAKAMQYIHKVGGKATTTDEALKECLLGWLTPTRIAVKKNKTSGFWDIISFDIPTKNN